MKTIITFVLIIICIGCSSTKDKKIIPYLLNKNTEESIYNELLKLNENRIVVFYLEHLPNSNFKIHLIDGSDKDEFISTNRQLFINNKFYPLIFDTDYFFYTDMENNYPSIVSIDAKTLKETKISIPKIDERIKNPESYASTRKTLLIDNSFYWVIDNRGRLIETNSQ